MKTTLLGSGLVRALSALTGALALLAACSPAAEGTDATDDNVLVPDGGGKKDAKVDDDENPNGHQQDGGGKAPVGDNPKTPGNDSAEATACSDSASCDYASHSCCVSGVGKAQCVEGDTCPKGGLIPPARTVCDGPEDCSGGKVCCVAVNANGAKNSCQNSCSEVSGLVGVWQLCHTDDDCPSDKNACAADDTFPFWGFCG